MESMARKAVALGALLVVAAALAAAPVLAGAVCGLSNDDMMKCQPAAAATTNPAPTGPSQDCCDALGKADLPCLCAYKSSPWMRLYNIDPARAMELPAKCGLSTPANC